MEAAEPAVTARGVLFVVVAEGVGSEADVVVKREGVVIGGVLPEEVARDTTADNEALAIAAGGVIFEKVARGTGAASEGEALAKVCDGAVQDRNPRRIEKDALSEASASKGVAVAVQGDVVRTYKKTAGTVRS